MKYVPVAVAANERERAAASSPHSPHRPRYAILTCDVYERGITSLFSLYDFITPIYKLRGLTSEVFFLSHDSSRRVFYLINFRYLRDRRQVSRAHHGKTT